MSEQKTNVMRMLDKAKIDYKAYTYDHEDGKIDGVSVAEKLNQDVKTVFKTIVTPGPSRATHVLVFPAAPAPDPTHPPHPPPHPHTTPPQKSCQDRGGKIRGTDSCG